MKFDHKFQIPYEKISEKCGVKKSEITGIKAKSVENIVLSRWIDTLSSSAIGKWFRMQHTLCVWACVTRENLATTQSRSARLSPCTRSKFTRALPKCLNSSRFYSRGGAFDEESAWKTCHTKNSSINQSIKQSHLLPLTGFSGFCRFFGGQSDCSVRRRWGRRSRFELN